MRILICGIGSIGQRHYKNLRRLGHELAVFRSGNNTGYNHPFVKKFLSGEEDAGRPVKEFFNLKEALAQFSPHAVWVTNPNARHMDVALPAARAGRHLFIEKPVSHTDDGLDELEALRRRHGLKIMVGYNLRFHPLLRKMKAMFEAGEIGAPISAHVAVGENIEDWHPWEDYRTAYAPWRSSGGGVALCFSHDIDYLYWFLGAPKRVLSVGGKLTPLAGDAEDTVKALWEWDERVVASLHLDYWQRPAERTFTLIGTTGTMTWDYCAGTLTLFPHARGSEPTDWRVPDGFDRNDMFVAEAEHFITAIREDTEPAVTLQDGVAVLRLAREMTAQLMP
ncbi:MAG: Gfo/Idh/MocA family oxidoreductase [Patescibacteria group bacterium]